MLLNIWKKKMIRQENDFLIYFIHRIIHMNINVKKEEETYVPVIGSKD